MQNRHICVIKIHTKTIGKNLSFMCRISMLFFSLIDANLTPMFLRMVSCLAYTG